MNHRHTDLSIERENLSPQLEREDIKISITAKFCGEILKITITVVTAEVIKHPLPLEMGTT